MLNDDDLLSWRSLVPAAAVISLEVKSSKRSVNSLHHLYKLGYIFVTCNFCTVPHVLYMYVLTLDLRWRKQIVSDIRYTGICLCIKQWSWTHLSGSSAWTRSVTGVESLSLQCIDCFLYIIIILSFSRYSFSQNNH